MFLVGRLLPTFLGTAKLLALITVESLSGFTRLLVDLAGRDCFGYAGVVIAGGGAVTLALVSVGRGLRPLMG